MPRKPKRTVRRKVRAAHQPKRRVHPARRVARRTKPTETEGILALVLNVIIFPGIGTLIGKRTTEGIIQIALMILGILLTFTFIGAVIGIPLIIGVWVWGIVIGIQILQESQR